MILVWFKNGDRGRLTSNSLTGHRERLIWTPSRKHGVRWKGQCRKPDLSSLPETVMSYGPLCQTSVMKLLRLHVIFDPWHDKRNQRSKQKGSGILIKGVSFWKNPFKGLSINFHFLCVGVILRRSQWPGGLWPLACWECGFESHGGMDVCPLWVVCVPKATASTCSTAWVTYRNMPMVGLEPM